MPSRNDDNQILVHNEEIQDDILDNRFGGEQVVDGDGGEFYDSVVLPTTTQHLVQPNDQFNFTYLVFYLLGAATMAPWNFFITAEDYWLFKFRNTTYNGTDPDPPLTPMQKNFTCDLTLTASLAGMTFLFLNAVYGHYVSLRLKMLGTMIVIFLVFIMTTAFVEVDTDTWQSQFFMMTMGMVVVINISSAVMSGGLFGMAGIFPSEYMTAVVSGQALGGIFTALAFILALTFGASAKTTAFLYFSIGIFIVFLSIVTYMIMERQKFFKYYINKNAGDPSTPKSGLALKPNFKEVFGKVYMYSISLCTVFAVTLSVYPAVTELVQSEGAGKKHIWNDIYFMPVTNYLCFNSGDYLGRIFAGLLEKPRNDPHLVLLYTIMRVIFIPLFMMSNSHHYFLPTVVNSDVIFISMMVIFAISNGYLTNIILVMAPKSVMQHEKEMASAIMAAALSVGIALGASVSMVFVELL
ncbi:equilibrative nucleoside transporter 1 [Episyrphus balteatus]|uniref:equilibrative nucleoside transporter 1 n=1 Tax=Episyrphus balteatus TaxID=286459 RepID=UPI002485D5A4|nr:equilibrative nucleoside transporter 1 [Episyrphus balteatus]